MIGGSEHDTWEMNGEIWKVTRPDRFGWTALPGEDGVPEIAEATPLDFAPFWTARDMSPLSHWPTCRPVGKLRHVGAVHSNDHLRLHSLPLPQPHPKRKMIGRAHGFLKNFGCGKAASR